MSLLESIFKLKENKTTVQNEIIAGFTTFITMAYILAVNPSILSASGMDVGAVFTATAVSAAIGTMLMAGLSNYPFALAPGMGPNAFLAYTVCGAMGYSWKIALTAVFIEGIIFVLLSVTKIREMLFDSISMSLKIGILLVLVYLLPSYVSKMLKLLWLGLAWFLCSLLSSLLLTAPLLLKA